MVTSSSGDEARWAASVLLFSGQPNPTWPLTQTQVEELLSIWDALPPTTLSSSDNVPTRLGYSGVLVCDGRAREWIAREGVVTLQPNDCRVDESQRFERCVIASAPRAALPDDLLGP